MILVPSLLVVMLAVTAEAKRAGAAPIIDVDPDIWVQECATVFQETCCRSDRPGYVNYSTYDVLKKPSGLCKPEFSCAYEKCLPKKYQTLTGNQTYQTLLGNYENFVTDFLTGIDITTNTTYADVELILGPGLNLPRQIVFPTGPLDVIEAIQYAKDEGLTVSIIATGHSYTGASTSAQSVQLNLREYPKYSSTEGIVECTATDDTTTVVVATKKENQAACKLALARGKKALVRVGGGEIFNEVANSVWAYKDDDDNNTTFAKYMMLHGVGTVGAAGGWLQGGGLGWGQERVWGLGVDQVLEIEMILADETHVKFYPVQWEDDEGFTYPRTTKVEGVCNTNTGEEESDWVWEACSDRIAFEDLWFAVRGGGGGTYGVVLSVKIQLHENIPMYLFTSNGSVTAENDKAVGDANLTVDELNNFSGAAAYCKMDFFFNFLFNPTQVNVSRDDSNACGSAAFSPLYPFLVCLGESASTALKASHDKSIAECLDTNAPGYQEYGLDIDNATENIGPFDSLLGQFNTDSGTGENVPGQLTDDGPSILPQVPPYSGWCSAQVPHSFLAAGRENESIENLLIEMFLVNSAVASHVTGGDVSVAHDQMNAVPITERQSGFASAYLAGLPTDLQEQLLKVFLNETIAKGENFPGISEFNHICSDSHGPLKSDMTKPCNLEYSEDEKDELCYSMQESVWGIEGTEKLEKIKDAVDPDGLFYCYGCIQSSKKGQPSSPPSSSVTTVSPKIPMVDGSTESSSSLKSRYDFTIVSFAVFVVVVAGSW